MYFTPIMASTWVSPADPVPAAIRASMASSSLVLPTEPMLFSCIPAQFPLNSASSTSSIGRPQTYSPKRAPGTASTA